MEENIVNETVVEQENQIEEPKNIQMGQIAALQYGKSEAGIGMTFVVKILQGSVTMFMPLEQVNQLVDTYNISDLNVLMQQKQACAVEVTSDGKINFIKLV